jgi:hypothetical protein
MPAARRRTFSGVEDGGTLMVLAVGNDPVRVCVANIRAASRSRDGRSEATRWRRRA